MFISILDHVLDRLRGLHRLAYGIGRQWAIAEGEWCSGRYLEVVLGRRVVVTWGWDSGAIPVPPGSSTVAVDLLEHPEGTLVRVVHRDLAPEVRRLHAEGWSRFLPRLAAVVAGRDPGEDPARDRPPPLHP
jgi:uncharacterized protein YndB with AHSA1/START domain